MRGLRQGDPLSPMLFILVMESFSRTVDRVVLGGHLKGFSVVVEGVGSLLISHLLFADDTLVFCWVDWAHLDFLGQVLTWFLMVSGLKINLRKCEIIPGGEMDNIELLTQVLHCKVWTLPTAYLGLSSGTSSKDISVWNSVVRRAEKRLAGWKKRYLSKGGEKVLIKSTLLSISTYCMSLFHAPISVIGKLERFLRTFLWDSTNGLSKLHLLDRQFPINWEGLELKDLRVFDKALLGKWLW